jgi:hypothetical protein
MELSSWYDGHPLVRRLWAVQGLDALNVILSLEPAADHSECYGAWLANRRDWAREITVMVGGPVRLELLAEPLAGDFEVNFDGEVVAAFNWRDPSCTWTAD